MDNLLTLYDRIEVIKQVNEKYDLENNGYISFSGGKDSTMLHHLIDMALPNNTIPRVFIDTGIEYNDIVVFVKELSANDNRFITINPSKPIKQTLEKYGYPFKSKQHSHNLSIYQHSGMTKSVKKYLGVEEGNNIFKCPLQLKYQFLSNFNLKVSELCCTKLKKEPAQKYEQESKRNIAILGLMQNEGGQRMSHTDCVVYEDDTKTKIKKFKPLNPISKEFQKWFIDEYKIELCKLYYPPYNMERTGCKGCPFTLDLQGQLDTMEKLLPNEKKQCEIIWKPVYDEYRRIGYRLKATNQLTIDDFIKE